MLRNDQVAIYLNDLYKTQYDSNKQEPSMRDKIFKVTQAPKLAGDKRTQHLGAGN
jgi:hypothetical protein